MVVTGHSHKPGVWKQQNKLHKTGRHRSKGEIGTQNKGRVDVKTISKKQKKVLQKNTRRNRAQQIRSQKREEALNRKRSVGVGSSPPHLVALIPLHHSVDIQTLSQNIQLCGQNDGAIPSASPLGSAGFTLNVPRLRHRFQIIQPGSSDIVDVLNCARACDTVIFIVSCHNECVDSHGSQILSCLLAQGISSQVFCVQGMNQLATKLRNPTKKEIIKTLEHYVTNFKLLITDAEQDIFGLLRHVSELKRKKIGVWEKRPYMLIEKLEFSCEKDDDSGTLEVSGHVRGSCLDVNRLVHLPGWGDFQVKQIVEVAEHCPFSMQRTKPGDESGMDEKVVFIKGRSCQPYEIVGRTLVADPELQQDLVREADVDPLEAEQTWPTDEEIREAETSVTSTRKMAKRVPKGTSEYQAAWILDENEDWEDVSDVSDEDDDCEMNEDLRPHEEEQSQVDEEDLESVSMSVMDDTASQYDDGMGDDPAELRRFREERSHEMFPDEIDTPMDIAAKVRFQRYRGLKSFRTSPWDPKENLPSDYARIFQFQSFERSSRKIRNLEAEEENSVQPGTYVTVHLQNVPKSFVDNHSASSTITLFGLFPHEQKMSVLHFAMKQYGEHSMRNKDELVFHVGFRQFKARPIFSQHTLGSKHKMERFFPKQAVTVATVYAPITFLPANVIAFKESQPGGLEPVATGTLYKVDPDHVVVKRLVLTGHPFRINKRAATIRYMFFQRDDVLWFKPVELRTKCGRRGHIKEPLGTHGHMKCVFDAQLTSQDTVMMMLYKRVFPKWSYQPIIPSTQTEEPMFDEEFFSS